MTTSQSPLLYTTQIDTAQVQANAIANAPTSTVGSNEFVYFAAFDGTDNGADPATDGSGNKQNTAVRQLYEQASSSGNFDRGYFAGPGTPGSEFGSAAIPATVTAQSRITAEKAYNDFAQKA